MKSKVILVSALSATLLSGCFEEESGSEMHRTISKNWPREGITKLELNSVHGSIDIKAGSGDTIKLVAEGHFSGSAGRALGGKDFLDMKVSNGVLKVEERFVEQRTKIFRVFGHSGKRYVDYTIEVPATLALVISNVSGEIEVAGVNGATQLNTVNGAIEVTTGSAHVEANSVNGSIEARFTERFAGAKLHTVNGPVEVTVPANAAFVANVSQITGGFESNIPVEVRRRGGSFSAVVGPGSSTASELEVNTVNGDVSLIRDGSRASLRDIAPPERHEEPRPEMPEPELPQIPGETVPPAPPAPPKPAPVTL